MPEGFSLNISAEILKKLDAADEKLQRIATHSEEVSKNMKKLSTDGINSVVKSLTEMNTHLTALSRNSGLSSIGTQASQSVDAINKMVNALAQLTNQQQLRLQTQQAKLDYKKEANDLRELVIAEDERARALDRQNKANIASNKKQQALETKKLANDVKELMNIEQERGRQLILQNQKSIASYAKQSTKLKQQIDEINRLAKAYKQMPTKLKQIDLNKIITGASKAKTINQHIVAIHNLQSALKDLDTTSKSYHSNVQRINAEIQRNRNELAKLGVNLDKVRKQKRNLMDTAGQLQRKIALIFSVSQIVGYVNKLVSVRKEFELQRKSLEVLLQSKNQADKLWQQTMDLAVKSPFRVKELITYTRQLAAYRIETDKLHDTTRRLSDVSSGLGVDMQRLILAYGQVRAAGFLRGTELRQFTEAGIPMLDELAKYLTEIEGVSVGVGEVFERISKRMISFKDVSEVFHRMTDAGGAFYKMQEEQSKTLSGMISNLHDSIDLMLNDIGQSNEWILKGFINFARHFVEHWELVAEALKSAAAGLVLYKLNVLLASDSLKLLAIDMGVLTTTIPKQLTVIQLLKTGWSALSKSIASTSKSIWAFVANNPLITFGALAITILGKAAFTLWEHNKAIKDISDNYDKMRQKMEAIKFDFNAAKNEKDIKKLRKSILDIIGVAERDYGINFKINVEELNEQELISKFDEISQKLFDANVFTEGFQKAFQSATEWVVSDDVFEDLKELGTTASDVFEKAYNKRFVIVNKLKESESKLNDEERKALTMLSKRKSDFNTELEFLENLRNGYDVLAKSLGGYYGLYEKFGITVDGLDRDFTTLAKSISEAKAEYLEVLKTINLDGLTDEEKTLRLTTAINTLASQQNWNQFVRDYIYQWTHEEVKVKVGFEESKEDGGLLAWQYLYNQKFEGYKGFQKIEDSATKQSDIIERLNAQLKTTEELYKRMQQAGEGAYSNYQFQSVEREIQNIKEMRSWFGEMDKTTGKDWMSDVIKGIKEAHQEYLKLNETLDASEAKQMALNKYAKAFMEAATNAGLKNISLGQFNFETEEGTIEALEFLKSKLPQSAKQARFKLEQAIGDIYGEVRVKTKVEEDKDLINEIEDMFSGYEMSIELQKLNIPPDLAKQLFNIDSLTLPELKDKVVSMESQFVGTKMEEEYRKFLEKIDEMEEKAQMERLKKYTQYLIKAQSERAKIKLEEMRQLEEIENTFQLKENVAKSETIGMNDKEWVSYQNILSSKKLVNNETLKEIGLSQELIDKIIAYNEQMKLSKKMAMEGVRKETQEKLAKAQFNTFKESSAYQMMFKDVKYYSEDTIKIIEDGLKKVRSNLKNLGISELKELTEFENKLFDIKLDKNPFVELKDSLKAIKELQKKGITPETENAKIVASEEEIEKLQTTLNLINIIQQKGVDGFDFINIEDTRQYNTLLGKTKEELSDIATEAQGNIDKHKGIKNAAENNLNTYNKTAKAAQAAFLKANNTVEQLSNAYDSLSTMLDSVGVNMEQSDNAVKNIGLGLVDLAMQFAMMVVQAELMGVAINAAMGPIGWAAAALTAVATIFTGIFGAHDKKREKQIKKEQELIENLQKAYEKLEKKIENAYNINTLEQANDQAEANLKAQIAARQRQIALEEDKKKTDQDAIKEYKAEIEELRDTLEELEEKRIAALGGFGNEEAYKSATEEFVSAWLDAYKEAGDGLSGLEEQFKEFFEDMVKNQLMMRGVDKFLDPFYKQFDAMFSDTSELGGKVSKKEIEAIKNMWQTISPELNEFMESLVESLGIASDLSSSTNDLSGLQRGIQGVTEETAQIIEAYLNSIRFFVAEQTTYLSQIASSFGNTEMENPMVSELKTQTEMIRAIRDMFSSVIRNGHPTFGGAFIKVAL